MKSFFRPAAAHWAVWLLLPVGLLCWAFGIRCSLLAQQGWDTVSLHYDSQPLSAAQLRDTLQLEEERGISLRAVLWEQEKPQTVYTRSDAAFERRSQAAILRIWGTAGQTLPIQLLRGDFPTLGDGNGCAMDQSTAEALFGSGNIVGLRVGCNGKEYIVRGLFQSATPLFVCQDTRKGAVFSRLELSFSGGTTQELVDRFLERNPLPMPMQVLNYAGAGSFLAVLCLFPLLPLLVYSAAIVAACGKRLCTLPLHSLAWKLCWWLAIVLLAVFALAALRERSVWFPGRMSDFEGWSRMFSRLFQPLTLPLLPLLELHDTLWRTMVWSAIAGLLGATCCCGILLWKWRKQSNN